MKDAERSEVPTPSGSVVGSEEEMIEFAAGVAENFVGGEVLGLVGDLGAGKTHFVKGLAKGLASRESVTSPTFTLVHEYGSGRLRMCHFDLYRLECSEEVIGIGWDEYFEDDGAVFVVEWAEKFPALMPGGTQWWHIEILDEKRRRVERRER